jgi:D-alanyl-D-alanine carboxypeptidase/LysM domain
VPLRTYIVKRGDSLSRIATSIYHDSSRWRLLAEVNDLKRPWYIYVGQSLTLPDVPEPPAPPRPEAVPVPPPLSPSDRLLAKLAPPLALLGTQLMRDCHAEGVSIRIQEGFRSWSVQDETYAKGRTAPGHIVTYARGGESFHNFGLAFDIVLLDASGRPTWDARNPGWATAGRLGVALGLRWGGHWKRLKDLPHFELRVPLSLEECRRLYPLGLDKIWNRLS